MHGGISGTRESLLFLFLMARVNGGELDNLRGLEVRHLASKEQNIGVKEKY